MNDTKKTFYILFFVLALAANFAGIDTKFFTDDQGLYASIAKNLIYQKHFFELFTYNRDWLDKPHFPFWMILLSFKLFGISEWAYRLPALIFFLIGLRYTWLFARKFYNPEVARIAVLILMTALNTMMSNTDVRAEPYLVGLIIGAIYHVSRLEERFSMADLLLGALLTACAIMTKGIFVITAIYGALLGQLIFQRKFKSVFQWRWLMLFLLTTIFVLPELYALYTQFDMHPEKIVFGRQHVSGIKWFLWDSQFGRFANTGPITRSSGSIFFYIHTLLWAFAPWCLLFYYAIFKSIKALIKKQKLKEYYTLSGGLLLLLLFSLSGFQLPFYTNTLFPLFAIMTAPFLFGRLSRFGARFRSGVLWLFVTLLPIAVITVQVLLKPMSNAPFIASISTFVLLIILVALKFRERDGRIFYFSCAAALVAGAYINTVVFNEITPYKGQIAAADYVNQLPANTSHVSVLTTENNIFQFYCKRPVDLVPIEDFQSLKPDSSSIFFVNSITMNQLRQNHASFKVLQYFINYPKETLLPAFINHTTRYKTLDNVYLITKD